MKGVLLFAVVSLSVLFAFANAECSEKNESCDINGQPGRCSYADECVPRAGIPCQTELSCILVDRKKREDVNQQLGGKSKIAIKK